MKFNKAGAYNLIEKTARWFLKPNVTEKYGWFGDYPSWEEAKNDTSGYDSNVILEKVKNSLLKVKNGEAIFERDSFIFDEIQYSWGVLAALSLEASKNKGKLEVLDFGGSLGSGYFQNRQALQHLESLHWSILEQDHFVDCGKENFENEQLSFFHDYEEFSSKRPKPNVLLLSSVIQYLEEPFPILTKLLSYNISTVVIDMTTFIEGDGDMITIQKVPPHIYEASYPTRFFNKEKLINFFVQHGYQKMGEWKLPYDLNMGYHAGIIFNKN
ncbi:MAG: methyltransferase, TIGR04325 family [Methylotenera sp.]|nr:methyltransferase, TIGR04325 family [Flavobacterium sp.]